MVTAEQMDRVRRLALELAGIELLARHRELLARRGRRCGIRDTSGWGILLAAAEQGEVAARRRIIELVTTGFTGFFRHPAHFKRAAEHLFAVGRTRGHARAWSVAAATGEEVWSIAMAVAEGDDPLPVSILGTDLNASALAAALQGEYGGQAIRNLTPARQARFLESVTAGRWRIVDSLRRRVAFLRYF